MEKADKGWMIIRIGDWVKVSSGISSPRKSRTKGRKTVVAVVVVVVFNTRNHHVLHHQSLLFMAVFSHESENPVSLFPTFFLSRLFQKRILGISYCYFQCVPLIFTLAISGKAFYEPDVIPVIQPTALKHC